MNSCVSLKYDDGQGKTVKYKRWFGEQNIQDLEMTANKNGITGFKMGKQKSNSDIAPLMSALAGTLETLTKLAEKGAGLP